MSEVEGAASTEPPQMPDNAWSELQSIAERLRWLANEPDAKEGMASTVTWRQKLDDAAFLFKVASALGTHKSRLSTSSEVRRLREALERCAREMRGSIAFTHEYEDALAAADAALSVEGEDEQATRGDDAATAPTDR